MGFGGGLLGTLTFDLKRPVFCNLVLLVLLRMSAPKRS